MSDTDATLQLYACVQTSIYNYCMEKERKKEKRKLIESLFSLLTLIKMWPGVKRERKRDGQWVCSGLSSSGSRKLSSESAGGRDDRGTCHVSHRLGWRHGRDASYRPKSDISVFQRNGWVDWDEVMLGWSQRIPVIILDVLTGVDPVDRPDVEPILAWSFTMGSDKSHEHKWTSRYRFNSGGFAFDTQRIESYPD